MIKQFRIPPANAMLLLASLVVMVPFVFLLPLWIGLLGLTFFSWRVLHDAYQFPLPGIKLRAVLTLVAFLLILWQFHTVLGRQAGASFLLLLMSLKLLEINGTRDEKVVIFLAYFMVAVSFLFNQSLWMSIYLFAAVFLLALAFLALTHEPLRHFGQTAFLKIHAKRLVIMFLQALPLTAMLFVFFPRLSEPLWGLPEDAFSSTTGLADRMAPGEINRLLSDTRTAFRAKFENNTPQAEQLYWRALVLDHFDGWEWRDNSSHLRTYTSDAVIALSDPLSYNVTIEPHQRNWLYALEMPTSPPSQGSLKANGLLRMPHAIKQTMRYQLSSALHYKMGEATAPDNFLDLPDNFAIKARRLAQQWRGETTQSSEIVDKALQHFRNEAFFYSREPPLLFDDPVDEFLFETRRGYCEHYASSFTVLMRAAGIPARVVIGYQGGEYNPVDDYFIIRQSDAHAWSEVWLDGKGWQRIDPTSAIPLHRIDRTSVQMRLRPEANKAYLLQQSWLSKMLRQSRLGWDAINYRWKHWVIGFSQKRQQRIFESLGWNDLNLQGIGLLFIALFAMSVMLVLLPWPQIQLRRRDPLNKAYQRYCKKMTRAGVPHQQWESANEYAERIAQQRPDLCHTAKRIAYLYNALRYGRTRNQPQLTELQQLVAQLPA